MFRTAALCATFLTALTLCPRDAFCFRPDFDGERGIEASVSFGYGSFSQTSERLFWTADQARLSGQPSAISGGASLRFALGYRFMPLLSAGLTAQVQFLGASPVLGLNAPGLIDRAMSYSYGLYVRFYPAPLIFQNLDVRRVRFDGIADARRLDPWISLGFDFYQSLSRSQTMAVAPYYAQWTRESVGVPIGIGLDVRPFVPLAIGISASVAPWIGSGVNKNAQIQDANGNVATDATHFDSVESVNVGWTVSLDVRYTLSL